MELDLRVRNRRALVATGRRSLEPTAPVVVLIHGAGMDRTVWARQIVPLASHGWQALAVDLPGHGGSEGPPLPTIAALADWIPDFLDAAGIERAGLAGHSMGGLVALTVAARHPDRVRALALLGAAERMGVNPKLLAAAESDEPSARSMVARWSLADTGHAGEVLEIMGRAPAGVLGTDLAACDAYRDGPACAAAVACPAAVILGGRDRMSPPDAGRALAAAIPGARTVELPDAGHMMMIEAPADTAEAVSAALAAPHV